MNIKALFCCILIATTQGVLAQTTEEKEQAQDFYYTVNCSLPSAQSFKTMVGADNACKAVMFCSAGCTYGSTVISVCQPFYLKASLPIDGAAPGSSFRDYHQKCTHTPIPSGPTTETDEPKGWSVYANYCAAQTGYMIGAAGCVSIDHYKPSLPKQCDRNPGTSHPIKPIYGNETYTEPTGLSLSGQSLDLYYDSIDAPWANPVLSDLNYKKLGQPGMLWWNSLDRRLNIKSTGNSSIMLAASGFLSFNRSANSDIWIAADNSSFKFWKSGSSPYSLIDRGRGSIEQFYDGSIYSGMISQSATSYGARLKYNYSSYDADFGTLRSIQDQFGRTIGFWYKTGVNGGIVIDYIQDPIGRQIKLGYNANGDLSDITWQNNFAKHYIYDSVNPGQAWALTGVQDELQQRFISLTYAPTGWANSSVDGSGFNKYLISYDTEPSVKMFDRFTGGAISRVFQFTAPSGIKVQPPSGGTLEISTASYGAADSGDHKIFARSGTKQPAGAGCLSASNAVEYSDTGNKLQEDDFNGHRTCFAYTSSVDGLANMEKVRIEGLPKTAVCTNVLASADLPATTETAQDGVTQIKTQSRKISTQWHPTWALKTKQAEPNLLTTWVYNGQPDPFNGNQTASCVTNTFGGPAALPDGSPTAVLCRKVEQRTTDDTGSLGFGATPDTSDPDATMARQWKYSYTEYGQVLTSKGPMSLDEVTTPGQLVTYTYYPDTSFSGTVPNEVGHTKGDLQTMSVKVSDTYSLVTNYQQYDRSGHLLQMRDANDLLTTMSYAPRGWLTSVNQGGLLTQYEYWPTGLLKKATQPDGSYLYYKYDDAHRLTDVGDKVDTAGNFTGNWVHYTLDNAGNRTSEDVKDSGGTLTRNITRTYDALNRLQTVKGLAQ